jgi:hypothetical protein
MKTVSLGLVAALLLTGGTALADTPVHWSISSLNAIVPAGASRQVTFSFQATENLGNITFRVAPELLPYVQVSPAAISNVMAGSSTAINITLKAGAATKSFVVDGVIQARAASGQLKVFARPLPVHLLIEISNIAGTDADGNGVWDYVDAYIAQNFADNPAVIPALQQVAKAVQASLLDASDKTLSVQHGNEYSRASECLYSFPEGREKRYIVMEKLVAAIINTRERSRAEVVYNEQTSGAVFEGVKGNQERTSCNF